MLTLLAFSLAARTWKCTMVECTQRELRKKL